MRSHTLSAAALVAAALVLPACGPSPKSPTHAGTVTDVAAEAASDQRPLSFIENDYEAALARARERKTPLFVEVWAPW